MGTSAPLLRSTSGNSVSASRTPMTMMPIGIPKVAYRVPGSQTAEYVDIFNRLYREVSGVDHFLDGSSLALLEGVASSSSSLSSRWLTHSSFHYSQRIVFLGQEIDDELANQIIGVLLYLDNEDSSKPIYLYVNCPGGSVIAGLALYDTMQHIKSEVITINVGMAASMASFLLAAGQKGKRMALPHSRVMIHQPMGGAQGQAEDIKVRSWLCVHEPCRIFQHTVVCCCLLLATILAGRS